MTAIHPMLERGIVATYRPEPPLRFAGERWHVDPKVGLARFGPASLGLDSHPNAIRLGYVGSGTSIAAAHDWFSRASEGIAGVANDHRRLPEFPGFAADRGFFSELSHPDRLQQRLTTHEISGIKSIRKRIDRFKSAVELISDRVRILSQQDAPPQVVVLALPDDLLENITSVRYHERGRGLIVRNLRLALKAELMRHGLPTQILLQRVSEAAPGARSVDHASRVAWNLLTSLYYKAGGMPWGPIGLRADTCYVGVSFHRPLGSSESALRTSVAQAFDEQGLGLVLRGPDVQWDETRQGRSPHLNENQASALMQLVLTRYEQETQPRRQPSRVVVHKTSRFWPAEIEGFRQALRDIAEFDLVAVAPTSEVRLVRAGKYPPLRGTLFTVGEVDYLYTTGYIPALQTYPHGHVPAPLQIADHVGDSSRLRIADELLILTKMNWNSANFAGALPITIRFSRGVGDVMREIPPDRQPEPNFKFYT